MHIIDCHLQGTQNSSFPLILSNFIKIRQRNHYNFIVLCLLHLLTQEAQAAPDALVRGVHSGPHPGLWCAPGVLDCAALLALPGPGRLSPADLRPVSLSVSLAAAHI